MTAEVLALIAALASGEAGERQAAAEKLARLENGAQPAAVALVEACADADDGTRDWVVAALEGLGPPAAKDCRKIAALLKRPELDVAHWAATLLGRLKADGGPAVPELIVALDSHPDIAVRQRVAWALGQLGPAAAAAEGSLNAAAQGDDVRLARLASEALKKIH